MTKPKRFLDSLREMVSPPLENNCTVCHATYAGDLCPSCGNASGKASSDKNGAQSAYLVDLVSNHKIQIPIPLCKVGRDECNDIVISGDQAISRQHLLITKEGEQFFIEDVNSRHGTYLNGNQSKVKEPINDGDVLKIGVSLFWFVAEVAPAGDNASDMETAGEGGSAPPNTGNVAGEPQHVSVKSEFFLEPTDPNTSTANDIPIMTNEEVLLDRLRLKTRSFEHSDMIVQAQLQPGAIRIPGSIGTPAIASSTQPFLPALGNVLAGVVGPPSNGTSGGFESLATERSAVATKPEASPNVINAAPPAPVAQTAPIATPAPATSRQSVNDYLAKLELEHNQLQSHIEQAEKRRQEIANEMASTKELTNSLIGGTDTVLMAACQKVLAHLGWQCKVTGEDGQDLQLKADNQDLIVHIMWTTAKPDRSHLGKLFIAQTRFWCDQGLEPKGILIVGLLAGDNTKKHRILLDQDTKVELANFVKNKNVCLLTTANLLAIYHDTTMNHLDGGTVRMKIMQTDGWLEGFDLAPLDNNS